MKNVVVKLNLLWRILAISAHDFRQSPIDDYSDTSRQSQSKTLHRNMTSLMEKVANYCKEGWRLNFPIVYFYMIQRFFEERNVLFYHDYAKRLLTKSYDKDFTEISTALSTQIFMKLQAEQLHSAMMPTLTAVSGLAPRQRTKSCDLIKESFTKLEPFVPEVFLSAGVLSSCERSCEDGPRPILSLASLSILSGKSFADVAEFLRKHYRLKDATLGRLIGDDCVSAETTTQHNTTNKMSATSSGNTNLGLLGSQAGDNGNCYIDEVSPMEGVVEVAAVGAMAKRKAKKSFSNKKFPKVESMSLNLEKFVSRLIDEDSMIHSGCSQDSDWPTQLELMKIFHEDDLWGGAKYYGGICRANLAKLSSQDLLQSYSGLQAVLAGEVPADQLNITSTLLSQSIDQDSIDQLVLWMQKSFFGTMKAPLVRDDRKMIYHPLFFIHSESVFDSDFILENSIYFCEDDHHKTSGHDFDSRCVGDSCETAFSDLLHSSFGVERVDSSGKVYPDIKLHDMQNSIITERNTILDCDMRIAHKTALDTVAKNQNQICSDVLGGGKIRWIRAGMEFESRYCVTEDVSAVADIPDSDLINWDLDGYVPPAERDRRDFVQYGASCYNENIDDKLETGYINITGATHHDTNLTSAKLDSNYQNTITPRLKTVKKKSLHEKLENTKLYIFQAVTGQLSWAEEASNNSNNGQGCVTTNITDKKILLFCHTTLLYFMDLYRKSERMLLNIDTLKKTELFNQLTTAKNLLKSIFPAVKFDFERVLDSIRAFVWREFFCVTGETFPGFLSLEKLLREYNENMIEFVTARKNRNDDESLKGGGQEKSVDSLLDDPRVVLLNLLLTLDSSVLLGIRLLWWLFPMQWYVSNAEDVTEIYKFCPRSQKESDSVEKKLKKKGAASANIEVDEGIEVATGSISTVKKGVGKEKVKAPCCPVCRKDLLYKAKNPQRDKFCDVCEKDNFDAYYYCADHDYDCCKSCYDKALINNNNTKDIDKHAKINASVSGVCPVCCVGLERTVDINQEKYCDVCNFDDDTHDHVTSGVSIDKARTNIFYSCKSHDYDCCKCCFEKSDRFKEMTEARYWFPKDDGVENGSDNQLLEDAAPVKKRLTGFQEEHLIIEDFSYYLAHLLLGSATSSAEAAEPSTSTSWTKTRLAASSWTSFNASLNKETAPKIPFDIMHVFLECLVFEKPLAEQILDIVEFSTLPAKTNDEGSSGSSSGNGGSIHHGNADVVKGVVIKEEQIEEDGGSVVDVGRSESCIELPNEDLALLDTMDFESFNICTTGNLSPTTTLVAIKQEPLTPVLADLNLPASCEKTKQFVKQESMSSNPPSPIGFSGLPKAIDGSSGLEAASAENLNHLVSLDSANMDVDMGIDCSSPNTFTQQSTQKRVFIKEEPSDSPSRALPDQITVNTNIDKQHSSMRKSPKRSPKNSEKYCKAMSRKVFVKLEQDENYSPNRIDEDMFDFDDIMMAPVPEIKIDQDIEENQVKIEQQNSNVSNIGAGSQKLRKTIADKPSLIVYQLPNYTLSYYETLSTAKGRHQRKNAGSMLPPKKKIFATQRLPICMCCRMPAAPLPGAGTTGSTNTKGKNQNRYVQYQHCELDVTGLIENANIFAAARTAEQQRKNETFCSTVDDDFFSEYSSEFDDMSVEELVSDESNEDFSCVNSMTQNHKTTDPRNPTLSKKRTRSKDILATDTEGEFANKRQKSQQILSSPTVLKGGNKAFIQEFGASPMDMGGDSLGGSPMMNDSGFGFSQKSEQESSRNYSTISKQSTKIPTGTLLDGAKSRFRSKHSTMSSHDERTTSRNYSTYSAFSAQSSQSHSNGNGLSTNVTRGANMNSVSLGQNPTTASQNEKRRAVLEFLKREHPDKYLEYIEMQQKQHTNRNKTTKTTKSNTSHTSYTSNTSNANSIVSKKSNTNNMHSNKLTRLQSSGSDANSKNLNHVASTSRTSVLKNSQKMNCIELDSDKDESPDNDEKRRARIRAKLEAKRNGNGTLHGLKNLNSTQFASMILSQASTQANSQRNKTVSTVSSGKSVISGVSDAALVLRENDDGGSGGIMKKPALTERQQIQRDSAKLFFKQQKLRKKGKLDIIPMGSALPNKPPSDESCWEDSSDDDGRGPGTKQPKKKTTDANIGSDESAFNSDYSENEILKNLKPSYFNSGQYVKYKDTFYLSPQYKKQDELKEENLKNKTAAKGKRKSQNLTSGNATTTLTSSSSSSSSNKTDTSLVISLINQVLGAKNYYEVFGLEEQLSLKIIVGNNASNGFINSNTTESIQKLKDHFLGTNHPSSVTAVGKKNPIANNGKARGKLRGKNQDSSTLTNQSNLFGRNAVSIQDDRLDLPRYTITSSKISDAMIRKKFNEMSLKLHPDKTAGLTAGLLSGGGLNGGDGSNNAFVNDTTLVFQMLNKAYDGVKSGKKRDEYDKNVLQQNVDMVKLLEKR